jgi:hypothetical protein
MISPSGEPQPFKLLGILSWFFRLRSASGLQHSIQIVSWIPRQLRLTTTQRLTLSQLFRTAAWLDNIFPSRHWCRWAAHEKDSGARRGTSVCISFNQNFISYRTHAQVRKHLRTYIHEHTYIHACTHTYIHVHLYVYQCKQTCIHT